VNVKMNGDLGMMSRTSQMRQADGAEERGASNWVPQVSQMARSPDSKFMLQDLKDVGCLVR
jgi:hypothetical protein